LEWQSQTIKSLAEGESFIKKLSRFWQKPGLILLSGPMGAGKTQVSKWILKSLGADASSPTFAIHQRYSVGGFPIDHFDLYRLQADEELENVGFWDAINEIDNLVIVEWADRLPANSFPMNRPQLHLQIESGAPNDARTFRWHIED
jgi:tRNA threonylcarbamoyl adenosine modification protein YjeE